ncbi:MFS transporter [Geothermobacter hydrogeniphilus]|uniref:Major facilitator superfamily (MFS) profile domain-containing protein n=1 Tax=Geothermobacter hydrogeniphilus TaxID=1969733 RepID=A0A1X0YBB4_9BACT|nr:MFS transporter [Geothermobacter hydrogeniphilus]ORJ62383.1 hypothetical protein B5V00_03600 [Geothermobacter hydrogeniphilus]
MKLIILTTLLTLSALYAPQPLLPVLAREFGVSRDAVALLTTIAFIPLSVAPLLYGYLLQSVSARRMLRCSLLLLGLSEFFFAAANVFPLLLGLRLLQGLLVPAILTALMTYVSQRSTAGTVQRSMAVYIAATILGGFLGRLCSGGLATLFGWRSSFIVLGISLLLCAWLLGRLQDVSEVQLAKPHPRLLWQVLRQGWFLRTYLAVFCLFLVFAAVMNYLPFRLTEISSEASELRIGLMYSGYLMGVVTALAAVRIINRCGGAIFAMLIGFSGYLVAIGGLLGSSVVGLFADMFLFCGSMFLIHATASGWLNRSAGSHKGVVNGLYIAFYYGGGVVGSSLPGPIYSRFGWEGVVYGLAAVAALGLGLVFSCLGAQNKGLPVLVEDQERF